MPTYYVEDFEELTGQEREAAVTDEPVETKVVVAPKTAKVKPATQAETK